MRYSAVEASRSGAALPAYVEAGSTARSRIALVFPAYRSLAHRVGISGLPLARASRWYYRLTARWRIALVLPATARSCFALVCRETPETT